MTIPAGGYPKMVTLSVTDQQGKNRVVPAVYPLGHVKQGTFVIFNSLADEASYDGTGVAASILSNTWENHHHT